MWTYSGPLHHQKLPVTAETVPAEAFLGLLGPLHAMVDHGGHGQRPGVAAQEGDVLPLRQTLQAVRHVVQRLLQEGGLGEHLVQVEVQQGDACGDRRMGSWTT